MKVIFKFLLFCIPLLLPFEGRGETIWLEAESFQQKGGWVLDQQHMDCMGSPYIMAHGLGKPVADASAEISIKNDSKFTVYVRTYNWTAPWWDGKGPGAFQLLIDGKKLRNTLGQTGRAWEWQKAGEMKLKPGTHLLSLHDLTGFNGRCDAICITDESLIPPNDLSSLQSLRKSMVGESSRTTQKFDFVVIGGGIAGMCAATSAARRGLKVALVNDRPVLGGNNSSEVRVHLGGHIEVGPNKGLGRMIREFGHTRLGNAQPAEVYEDAKKDSFIMADPNITYLPNSRGVEVRKMENRISGVLVRNIESGKETWLEAPLFSDCTGDGSIGYLAGAHFAMGRESRSQYGESLAPLQADSMTMGASVQWYSEKREQPQKFPEFTYGVNFNDSTCERVTMGEWKWETGMNRNQITESERIRDYGLMVIFSNWSWLKNHSAQKEKYRNRDLVWVAYIAGRRESRRLLGDYILKQDDIDKDVQHEDPSFTTTWSIDLHFPDPKNSKNFPGQEFKAATNHLFIHPYAVPYRCLYSRNIDNLLMAGRNISVTHVALGTVRVMRTTGMMGEVVGMAAALCKQFDTTPRGVYQNHLPELLAMMQAGAGRPASELPDNQNFNLARKTLDTPPCPQIATASRDGPVVPEAHHLH